MKPINLIIDDMDITPSWNTAVKIYIHVLRNPKATEEAKRLASEDLLKLANHVDKLNCKPNAAL